MSDCLEEKYSRQMLFAGIGPDGQRRLLGSRATIVGCGAIGAAAANLLVRAGVGSLTIIDRDFVEPSNLQRQTLFDESDARRALPKAIAAEDKLRSINAGVEMSWPSQALNALRSVAGCQMHRMMSPVRLRIPPNVRRLLTALNGRGRPA